MPDEATAPSSELVRIQAVSKRYGPTRALVDVSLALRAGEVHALMGENGAGKSTLGRILAGQCRPDAGSLEIAGRTLAPGDADGAFAAGIRIVHQEPTLCPHLSVAENIGLRALTRVRGPGRALGIVDRRALRERAAETLGALERGIDPDAIVGRLGPGRRQIVQIGAALAAPGARVLILDEPTSALAGAEVERLLRIVRELAGRGITVVYITHRMGEVFACCDRATVLRDGRFIATTPVGELDEPTLVARMAGRTIERDGAARAPGGAGGGARAAPAIEVSRLSSPGRLDGVSLTVEAGEIVGIGGLVGAGRSELLEAIFGLDARSTGVVRVAGREIRTRTARAMMAAGVGCVPEDRRYLGLFFHLGLDENILLPRMPALARWGWRGRRAERALVAERVASMRIRAASTRARPASLSGGNQQKLLLARWLTPEVRALLLDEPTRGIDVATKAEVHRAIRAVAARGAGVLLVTSDMEELLLLADRVVVLAGGGVTGELTGEAMTSEGILRLAMREAAGQGA